WVAITGRVVAALEHGQALLEGGIASFPVSRRTQALTESACALGGRGRRGSASGHLPTRRPRNDAPQVTARTRAFLAGKAPRPYGPLLPPPPSPPFSVLFVVGPVPALLLSPPTSFPSGPQSSRVRPPQQEGSSSQVPPRRAPAGVFASQRQG